MLRPAHSQKGQCQVAGRGAQSMGRISSGEAAQSGGRPRAVSCGSASGRWLLSVAAFILGLASAGVLQGNARRESTDRRRLIAARLALAQIGHPLAVLSKPASGKVSKLQKAAAAAVDRSPAPPVTPTAASASATVAPVPAPDPIVAYRGLGAWVDWFDYGHPWSADPA